jgi:hypothetical protein
MHSCNPFAKFSTTTYLRGFHNAPCEWQAPLCFFALTCPLRSCLSFRLVMDPNVNEQYCYRVAKGQMPAISVSQTVALHAGDNILHNYDG